MSLPAAAKDRKNLPVTTGVLDYFPLAIAEVARVSKVGNDQHNPGEPLHWAREKSTDHADCITRHLMERGTFDSDGMRHTAKVAWRALALLQEELEAEVKDPLPPDWREYVQRGLHGAAGDLDYSGNVTVINETFMVHPAGEPGSDFGAHAHDVGGVVSL